MGRALPSMSEARPDAYLHPRDALRRRRDRDAGEGGDGLPHHQHAAALVEEVDLVSKSALLMREVRLLVALCDSYDIQLIPRYIKSSENVVADLMSRMAAAGDYRVDFSILARVQEAFGVSCTVDAFASAATALLPRHWTAKVDGGRSALIKSDNGIYRR